MAGNTPDFDFHGMKNLQEIFNQATQNTLQQLEWRGVRPDKIQDKFYDALEADGVNLNLKWQWVDHMEPKVIEDFKKYIPQYIAQGGVSSFYGLSLDSAQTLSQHAIRIAALKGSATDPLIREIAREVSALPEAKHESRTALMQALVTAYDRVTNPVPPAKPKHFHL